MSENERLLEKARDIEAFSKAEEEAALLHSKVQRCAEQLDDAAKWLRVDVPNGIANAYIRSLPTAQEIIQMAGDYMNALSRRRDLEKKINVYGLRSINS